MFAFLYKHIFKPLAFAQDPERVHDTITFVGSLLGRFGMTRSFTRWMFAYENPSLAREVAGVRLKNPVGLAAGFDKNAHLIDILPYVGFGFAEFGSITAKPCEGNPKPRLWRLPESQALVVNYGLMNDGVDVILERIRRSRIVKYRHTPSRKAVTPLSRGDNTPPPPGRPLSRGEYNNPLQRRGGSSVARDGVGDSVLENFRIGISVAKTNCKETAEDEAGIADYYECFRKVNASSLADYITINVSCPNAYGGEPFTTPDKFERLSARLKEDSWKVPVFVKLPCDYLPPLTPPYQGGDRGGVEDFDGMLEIAVKYGYTGVILSNLTKDRANNPVIQKSDLSKVGKGGISGKPTFERSNRLIARVREKYSKEQFAVIGCGGVFSGEDAKTKLDAGADLIQMITGMIYEGPQVVGEINRYLVTHNS